MIDKQTQDQAWAALSFGQRQYAHNIYRVSLSKYIKEILETLYGKHNLTSDAEPEEMCVISKTNVEALHSEIHKAIMDAHDADDWQDAAHYILDVLPRSFEHLFGSKCLPDLSEVKRTLSENLSEQKPAEPKFKLGDRVKHIAHPHDDGIYIIDDIKKSSDGFIYHIQGLIGISNVKESDLGPYTEPEKKSIPSNLGELELQEADNQSRFYRKQPQIATIWKRKN